MKKLLILLSLSACGPSANVAEVMTKGQVPDAQCDTAVTIRRKIQVAVCTLPENKDSEFIAAYSKDHPYQALPFKTTAQIKAAAEKTKKEAETAAGSGSATDVKAEVGPAPKK